ncbi:MAG: hypothetical protein AABY04_03615, partial [Candidatus Micrarchaeota archaeon]
VIAIEKSSEAKIDFAKLQLPKVLERDAEIPLKIKVSNNGDEKLHSINVFFSEGIAILGQTPFDLDTGQTKEIDIVVKVEGMKDLIKTRLGFYAKEGFLEKEVEFEIIKGALEISQGETSKNADGFKTEIKIKNIGESEVRLVPSSLEGIGFSEKEIGLKAGEEFKLELNITAGNETIAFKDAISGKTYRKRIGVEEESGNITGLFVISLSKVGPFLIAIVGGAIAMYLVFSRKKLLERLDGKKESLEKENENGEETLQKENMDGKTPVFENDPEVLEDEPIGTDKEMEEEETGPKKSNRKEAMAKKAKTGKKTNLKRGRK